MYKSIIFLLQHPTCVYSTTLWKCVHIYMKHTTLCTSSAPQSVHSLATLLRFSTSRPFRASRAPSLANRTLVPAPIPELAPVIKATFPFRDDTYNAQQKHFQVFLRGILTCRNKPGFRSFLLPLLARSLLEVKCNSQ